MTEELENHYLKFWLGPFLLGQTRVQAEIVRADWMAPEAGAGDLFPDRVDHAVFCPSLPAEQNLPAITRRNRTIRYVEKRFWRHATDLTGSMEDYWKTFSGKTRSTLKRKLRKFEAEAGDGVAVRRFETPDEIGAFFETAWAISGKTYQERLYDAGLPKSEAFQKRMTEKAGKGAVKGYILDFRGEAIAYLFCPVEDGRVIYQFLGFDPVFADLSPGTVLQLKAFEDLMADSRCTLFDFTEGDGPHKRLFATLSRHCANILFLPDTVGNRILVWAHHGLTLLGLLIDRILDRL